MLVNTYNQLGEKIGQTRLPREIFDIKMNPDLVHQVLVSQMSNRRQGTAHTKDRSEVRGGGKKPWRQKGTGRARHGSIRSPLWKGGGVTFGPRKNKNYKKAIPIKMRRKALFMVLSEKSRKNLLIILDKLEFEKPKTKTMVKILSKLPCKDTSRLLALPKLEKNIILSSRNIPQTETIESRNLNILDLLNFKYLVLPKESIKTIQETFLK